MIKIYNPPQDIFDTIKRKQLSHMKKCQTCKYGMGQATVAYIRELIKENNELKKAK